MYYGYNWSWQKDECLARDNYSCQICDKTHEEGYRLCIHHIIPYNEFGVENEITIREAVLEHIEKNPNCSTDDIINAYDYGTWRILEVFYGFKNDSSKVWERHLEISKNYGFEIIFTPDSFTWSDSLDIIDRVKTFKQYCKRTVVPSGIWPQDKEANKLRNLICLCSSCHGRAHSKNNFEKHKKELQQIAIVNTEQFLREEKQTFTNNIRFLSPSIIKKIITDREDELERAWYRRNKFKIITEVENTLDDINRIANKYDIKTTTKDAIILFFRDNIESIEIRKKLYPEFVRVAEKTQDRNEFLQLFKKYLTEVQKQ